MHDTAFTAVWRFFMDFIMQTFKLSFLLLCGWLLHGPVHAQDYPQRAIKLVVPFPAGGGVDAVARAVAERLSTELQQPVLVDNRAGAVGALGASVVAKSA